MQGARKAKQLSIRLDEKQKSKLKKYAALKDTPMQALLEGVINEYINSLPDVVIYENQNINSEE